MKFGENLFVIIVFIGIFTSISIRLSWTSVASWTLLWFFIILCLILLNLKKGKPLKSQGKMLFISIIVFLPLCVFRVILCSLCVDLVRPHCFSQMLPSEKIIYYGSSTYTFLEPGICTIITKNSPENLLNRLNSYEGYNKLYFKILYVQKFDILNKFYVTFEITHGGLD